MTELLRLNLGCGLHQPAGYINVDIKPLPGVDLIADVDQPWPWKDGTVTEIIASHIFEHINKPIEFMAEAWRVLADDGILDIRVPHWQHIYAYTDPTHKRFCTELTFDYWVPEGAGYHYSYGAAFGSVEGGPRFAYDQVKQVGDEGEELRFVLRKIP